MITNFEEITADLNEKELCLVPIILAGFRNHTGKENIICSTEIIKKLEPKGIKITDSKLRKIVNYIRVNSLAPICSSSKGYWCSDLVEEIEAEILSMEQRSRGILNASNGLKKFLI